MPSCLPLVVIAALLVSAPLPRAAARGDAPLELSLADATARMLAGNRPIRAARLTAEIAAAEVRRVDVAPNPVVSAQIANGEAGNFRYGVSDRLLRVDQTVERGGKRRLRRMAAEAAEQAAGLDLHDTIRRERAALAAAYFALVAAQRRVELYAQIADGYDRLTDAARRRVQAGDLAEVDLARLQIEQSRAANDLRAAQGETGQARIALAAAIGEESRAAVLRATDALPDRQVIALQSQALDQPAESATIDRRADVSAARARLRTAERVVELAASQRTRDVTLGLQAERSTGFGGTVLGVSASFPIFVNNDFGGEIAHAQAELAAARDDVERTRAAARVDIDQARTALRDAADRADRLLEQALPRAQQVARAADFAFDRGALTLTDLFDIRRQLASVQTDAVAAQAEFARTDIAYQAALGRLSEAARQSLPEPHR